MPRVQPLRPFVPFLYPTLLADEYLGRLSTTRPRIRVLAAALSLRMVINPESRIRFIRT